MNYNEGHHDRRPSLPPFSSRTLHHPSFMPLYLAAGFGRHHTDLSNQTVHPIIPAEFFYTDPTMSCGRRVPNIVSDLRVFDCFQLNTPRPVMSSCPAPPTRPDPFRSAPHPTMDLGSPTVKINPLLHPPVQPSRVVLQLTQEEDQAITNLLKLHHQEPARSHETLTAAQMDLNPIPFPHPELMASASAGEAYEPFFCSDVRYPREASLQLQQGRCWSDIELEAANTLLSCFSLMVKDEIWGQNHNRPAATLPDPLPYQQNHEDSPISTETQQGSETSPESITTDDCAQNDYISFSCAREHGEPGWGDLGFVWVLSESEGDAVHVLLSLGDTGALDIVQ